MSDSTSPFVILLVDDDPGDQVLTRRALAQTSIPFDLKIVMHGEQALDYLSRRGKFEDATSSPTPNLILLDLNMPRMNGREFLQQMKLDETIPQIPVVVLTTSERDSDVVESYRLGCSSYIQKPVDIDDFIDVVQKLGDYWFEVVTLPLA